MTKKLKNIGSNKKIEKDNLEKQGRICAQFPTFSFRYITTNNHYNLDFFNDSDRRKKEETIHKLYERIEEISKQDWIYWGSLNKKSGYETIPYSSIKFKKQGPVLTGDENIYVFRVKSGRISDEARILGYKEDGCPIYYIIGYDYDYSAYEHGN